MMTVFIPFTLIGVIKVFIILNVELNLKSCYTRSSISAWR